MKWAKIKYNQILPSNLCLRPITVLVSGKLIYTETKELSIENPVSLNRGAGFSFWGLS